MTDNMTCQNKGPARQSAAPLRKACPICYARWIPADEPRCPDCRAMFAPPTKPKDKTKS